MPRGTAFFHTTGEKSGLADQAYGECLRAEKAWKEEEARYEQLGRMLELAFPPTIDVDVYHHYY
jgi:hypothetical protein